MASLQSGASVSSLGPQSSSSVGRSQPLEASVLNIPKEVLACSKQSHVSCRLLILSAPRLGLSWAGLGPIWGLEGVELLGMAKRLRGVSVSQSLIQGLVSGPGHFWAFPFCDLTLHNGAAQPCTVRPEKFPEARVAEPR